MTNTGPDLWFETRVISGGGGWWVDRAEDSLRRDIGKRKAKKVKDKIGVGEGHFLTFMT